MKKSECTGCWGCENICPNGSIKMQKNEEGFYYPYVNSKTCIHCDLCIQVCPIIQKEKCNKYLDPDVYVGYCTDDLIRKESSSGGIFPIVAEWCIRQGGVVFGARYDGVKVIHDWADNMDKVKLFKGSKYVQSRLGDTFKKVKQYLDSDRYVLFTGLPCEVEGLKFFLRKNYDKLYTIDLICHGIGSPGIWEKYVKIFHGKKIKSINFRNKDDGWTNEKFVIKYENGKEFRKSPLDYNYGYGFCKNIFLRKCCYSCEFKGLNRISDMTIGDAWGVENYAPRFRDNKGCSLIFVHSEKGKKLFSNIQYLLKYDTVNAQKAIRYNIRMMKSVEQTPYRELFFKQLEKYSFKKCMKGIKKLK